MSNKRRVLIVEDEALIAFLLEEMIQGLGYEVAGVASALNLAMALDPASFDMAILDVLLNGEEVYPFADTLKARGVPFAFATGNGGDGIPAAHRGVHLLQKPFQLEQLRGALEKMAG